MVSPRKKYDFFLVVGRVKIVGQTFKLLRSYVAARPTVGGSASYTTTVGQGMLVRT